MQDKTKLRYDIAVIGAGISGIFAALGAADRGAKVVLVDRFGAPGGNLGPGMIVGAMGYSVEKGWSEASYSLMSAWPKTVRSFFDALETALDDGPRNYGILSSAISRVLFQLFRERGIDLVLSAYAGDPMMSGSEVTGVFVETKSGRLGVEADVVIDATGDADIAMRAGAPVRTGSTVEECDSPNLEPGFKNPKYRYWNDTQIYFLIANADIQKYDEFRNQKYNLTDSQQQWTKSVLEDGAYRRPHVHWDDAMVPNLKAGWDSGEFRVVEELRNNLYAQFSNWFEQVEPGLAGGRAGVSGDFDTGDYRDVTLIEGATRCIAFDGVKYFSKNVPGFEHAYILTSPGFIGSRGGRFIEGDYVVTARESFDGLQIPDVMYVSGTELHRGGNERGYDMPYRMLLPKGVENLLVTARGASFHRRGHDPSTRARFNLMGLGLASGVAAALSIRQSVQPRKLDIHSLQQELHQEGFYLGDETRLESLNLK